MQGVKSDHPPGAVVMVSGDITRYAASMQALQSLKAPAGSVLLWNMGVLIARSINNGFADMMKNEALHWAFIMGDDHTYDPDILLRLLDRNLDAVVPLCLNRMPPMDPTIIDDEMKRLRYLDSIPTRGLYRLAPHETCGDAGLLVRRNVLAATGPNWYERIKSGAHNAEDQEFIARIKAAGFQVHVDVDQQLGHIGYVDFKPVLKQDENGGEHWEVRMIGGANRHIADLATVKRSWT